MAGHYSATFETSAVHCPDFTGLGYTEAAENQNISAETQAEMLAEFLDELKLKTVDVIANDTGGEIAQLFVARCVWQVFLAHLWQLTLAHLWQFAEQGGMEMCWAFGLKRSGSPKSSAGIDQPVGLPFLSQWFGGSGSCRRRFR
jgi:hypothetical protein